MQEPSHQAIEILAYQYWEQRGAPFGTPEIDWFRAEDDLRQADQASPEEPAIVAAAKAVGSAVGSVISAATHLIPGEHNH